MLRIELTQECDRRTDGKECYLTADGLREVRKYAKKYAGAEISKAWIVEEKKLLVEIVYQGQLYVLWLPAYERFFRPGKKRPTLSFNPRNRIPLYMYQEILFFADKWGLNYGDTMRKLIDMGIAAAKAEKEIKFKV